MLFISPPPFILLTEFLGFSLPYLVAKIICKCKAAILFPRHSVFIRALLWTEYSQWAVVCFYFGMQVYSLLAISCMITDKLLTLGRNDFLTPQIKSTCWNSWGWRCVQMESKAKKMLLTWIQLLDYLCSLCLFSPRSQCTNCTDISNRLCVLLVCFLLLPLVSNTKFIKPQANIFNWQQHIHSPYWADSPLSTPTGVSLFTFYAIAQHLQLCSVWTHLEKISLLMSSGLWFGLEDKKNYIIQRTSGKLGALGHCNW